MAGVTRASTWLSFCGFSSELREVARSMTAMGVGSGALPVIFMRRRSVLFARYVALFDDNLYLVGIRQSRKRALCFDRIDSRHTEPDRSFTALDSAKRRGTRRRNDPADIPRNVEATLTQRRLFRPRRHIRPRLFWPNPSPWSVLTLSLEHDLFSHFHSRWHLDPYFAAITACRNENPLRTFFDTSTQDEGENRYK